MLEDDGSSIQEKVTDMRKGKKKCSTTYFNTN